MTNLSIIKSRFDAHWINSNDLIKLYLLLCELIKFLNFM